MKRREFCKLVSVATAATCLPKSSEAEQKWPSAALPMTASSNEQVVADSISKASQALGNESFGAVTENYAAFCAKPPNERRFYEYRDGHVVEVRFDEKTWNTSYKGRPPITLPESSNTWYGVPMKSPIANLSGEGPYQPTWDSLMQYEAPEWYQDAKFGIWAHWSPQCVPEAGDWYARYMYMSDSPDYKYHLCHYGPQSRFGYKELCAQWTLLNWDPQELISRYKRAGARLFVALANHHDSFDAWKSKHQPWNAGNFGPHRDVVGEWAAAARAQGLRFGVSVHQARNWWWFQTSHGTDKGGPLAGVPYDGRMTLADGKNQWWEGLDPHRLYCVKHPVDALPDPAYVKDFYDRTRDLVDQHDPDLMYFDDALLPLGWAGMNIGSYFYNHNIATHGGHMEAVLNIKNVPDRLCKAVVADYERGITSKIAKYPWQSETCIGNWHYKKSLFTQSGEYGGYMSPGEAIHWMIDTVSKNGTFILNVPGKPDGTIDSKETAVLDGITAWMQKNGEAIYETRPWKISGEGPHSVGAGSGAEIHNLQLSAQDIRFTRNKSNSVIYVIALGWPEKSFMVASLGTSAATYPGRVLKVDLLGTGEKVEWKQTAAGLTVELPKRYRPEADYAAALKISLA